LKKAFLLAFVLVSFSLSILGTGLIITVGGSATLHVYSGESIQEAVNSAQQGDTIFVHAGTYYEHVVVSKSLLLIGENRNTTVIDGNGTGTVVSVYSNLVTVRGFTIQNSGSDLQSKGIYVHHSNGSNICHNIIVNNGVGIALKYSNNEVTSNSISNNIWGISLEYSNNSILRDNSILKSFIGIDLYHSSSNAIFHNNFINNTHQVGQVDYYSHKTNIWDNGYPSGGNYWSNYNGNDTDQDGIGDIPYFIIPYIPIENTFSTANTSGRDSYPLMGMFYVFSVTYQEESYPVNIICNSTISGFQFANICETIMNGEPVSHTFNVIIFDVTGENGTTGFCRICIPTALMNGTYRVLVNGTEVPYILLPFSNSTHSNLYFIYDHSTQEVWITPEFPTLTAILLTLIVLTVTTTIYKRRLLKTPKH